MAIAEVTRLNPTQIQIGDPEDDQDEKQLEKLSNTADISMGRLVCELQEAKDNQMNGLLGKTSAEIDKIHERTSFIADLVQQLVKERNSEGKEFDISHLEDLIRKFQDEEMYIDTGSADPFSGIYPGPLAKLTQTDLEQVIASLQELMRRDANLLQKLGRDSEYAMHIYTIICEALARQKLDERTFTRNQLTK